MNGFREFPCDICGSNEAEEIACARRYTNDQPVHVCSECGFVYVKNRRSARAIADSWSNELYGAKYTAFAPAARARHMFVAEMIRNHASLDNVKVCDIGAGEGTFLDTLKGMARNPTVLGIEPSTDNCRLMAKSGIANFVGTIEDYMAAPESCDETFDIVTILWTLENCQSLRTMLTAARNLCRPGGIVVVGTGSRILVPFKKPLHYYLGPNAADTHPFRFSANALHNAMAVSCLKTLETNRYVDSDYLVAIGTPTEKPTSMLVKDAPEDVLDFFQRWDEDTQCYYRDS